MVLEVVKIHAYIGFQPYFVFIILPYPDSVYSSLHFPPHQFLNREFLKKRDEISPIPYFRAANLKHIT